MLCTSPVSLPPSNPGVLLLVSSTVCLFFLFSFSSSRAHPHPLAAVSCPVGHLKGVVSHRSSSCATVQRHVTLGSICLAFYNHCLIKICNLYNFHVGIKALFYRIFDHLYLSLYVVEDLRPSPHHRVPAGDVQPQLRCADHSPLVPGQPLGHAGDGASGRCPPPL